MSDNTQKKGVPIYGNGGPTSAQKEAQGNFLLAQEYQDFIEFLDDELGVDERKALQEKFYKQYEE